MMVKLKGADLLKEEHRLGRRFASYLKLNPSERSMGQRLAKSMLKTADSKSYWLL